MNQDSEQFFLIERLVVEALAIPIAERNTLIETRCGGDSQLASEVYSLLASCAAEEQQMANCRSADAAEETVFESRMVGPYRIDRLLGCGGMGSVYLAHRADGHFEHQVAIKCIGLPFATEIFRERFRQERQILAALQHPHIARLLDGGVTDTGDPYLVMEYVDGAPIDRYCSEQQLNQRQRVELFLQVCSAVQFAHQNLIVHRDLKPDNILVTSDGMPKLLDFGTAKLVAPTVAKAESDLTRAGFLSFTPQYASPEQVLGQPITTATDTYSLGVLLYLLLTDAPPYQLRDLTTGEMLRVICHQEPLRPQAQAANRQRIDADLEAILLKALRKDAAERYASVERFADDLRAWRDGHPVTAQRNSFAYRTGKFIRRHQWGVAATAVVVCSLTASVAGVAWQARIADHQRRRAVARSEQLRELSNSFLSELDDAIKQLPGTTGVQKLLVTRVLGHLDRMAQDTQNDRQTQLDLMDAYTRLANLQGNTYYQNLGDVQGALVSIEKAIGLGHQLTDRNAKDCESLIYLDRALFAKAQILSSTLRSQETMATIREATSTTDRLAVTPGVTALQIAESATAYETLGDQLSQVGSASLNDMDGALTALRHCISLYEQALQMDPQLARARRGVAIIQLKIAETEMENDPARAIADLRQSEAQVSALSTEEQQSLRIVRLRILAALDQSHALVQLGRYGEADALAAGVVQSATHLAQADPQDLRALSDLQSALAQQAEVDETAADPSLGATAADRNHYLAREEKTLEQEGNVVEQLLRLNPDQSDSLPILADVQVHLGSLRCIRQKTASCLAEVHKGLDTLHRLAAEEQVTPAILDMAARNLLLAQPSSLRQPREAVGYAKRAVELSHHRMPSLLLTLAQAYHANGQIDACLKTANEALALLPAPAASRTRIRILLEGLGKH
jgi:tetratricopeptide (TPR) repeat protein